MSKQWLDNGGGSARGKIVLERKRSGWSKFVPLWGAAALAGTIFGSGWLDAARLPTDPIRAGFSTCHSGGGTNCVVDGDTLWLGGEKIRVADIDAPETHPPRCAYEAELGNRATRRLRELLNAGKVSVQPIDRDVDRYGRKLRIVLVNGRSVGDMLVDEGLARPYEGRRKPWC